MTTIKIVLLLQAAFLAGKCVGFQQQRQPLPNKATSRQQYSSALRMTESIDNESNKLNDHWEQRRSLLTSSLAAAVTGLFAFQQSAMAMPMAAVEEFNSVLRDAPLSIQVVEFSGPRSETVVVKLVDGTVFGIKDIVESPSDPRSPLKVVASCRDADVKTKFVDLEAVLAGSSKKKLYANERVRKAYELQAAQKERIRLDELDRLAQVEAQETAMAAAAEAAQAEAAAAVEASAAPPAPAVAE